MDIYYVDGNHNTILDNMKVAAAINDELAENSETDKPSFKDFGKISVPVLVNTHQRS